MILLDVNVLVYAHRNDTPDHVAYRTWLDGLISGDDPFGLPDPVLSGFVRIVTNRRIFQNDPTPIGVALDCARLWREQPNCLPVAPSPRHWGRFEALCRDSDAIGNTVPDAYLAALAIDSGCDLATADRAFARFRGLRWFHPLDR